MHEVCRFFKIDVVIHGDSRSRMNRTLASDTQIPTLVLTSRPSLVTEIYRSRAVRDDEEEHGGGSLQNLRFSAASRSGFLSSTPQCPPLAAAAKTIQVATTLYPNSYTRLRGSYKTPCSVEGMSKTGIV